MAGTQIITLTKETASTVEANLQKLKNILDNKDAAIKMGFYTQDQIDQIQITYDANKKLYDLYKPK